MVNKHLPSSTPSSQVAPPTQPPLPVLETLSQLQLLVQVTLSQPLLQTTVVIMAALSLKSELLFHTDILWTWLTGEQVGTMRWTRMDWTNCLRVWKHLHIQQSMVLSVLVSNVEGVKAKCQEHKDVAKKRRQNRDGALKIYFVHTLFLQISTK